MASQWGKFLAPTTVSGFTFVFVDGGGSHSITIPAATYATPLHVATALQTAIRSISGGAHAADTVVVSSTGYTTITCAGMTSVTWGSCSTAFKTFFGFSSESVSSNAVTSTLAHTHGWYPGVITRGVALGEGLAADTGWEARDNTAIAHSGNGSQRTVMPARCLYERSLTFGCLGRTEAKGDRTRGVQILRDRFRNQQWYWYPDRDDGAVGSYGTQGDPGYDNWEDDDDCNYYIVSVLTAPQSQALSRPDLFSVTLTLSCKAK